MLLFNAVLIVILISIIFVAVILFIPGPRKRIVQFPTQIKKAVINREEVLSKHSEINKLQNYAQNYLEKGYTYLQIIDTLTAEGWAKDKIDFVLRNIVRQENQEEEQTGETKHSGILYELRQAIQKDIDSGMSKKEITKKLQDAGWNKTMIKLVLKSNNRSE